MNEALKQLLDLTGRIGNCYIAGGYVSYMAYPEVHKPSDIDIFCLNTTVFNKVREELVTLGYRFEKDTEVATTYRNSDNAFNGIPEQVQVIKPCFSGMDGVVYSGIKHIVNTFDLSINKCYLEPNGEIMILDPDFDHHNRHKLLAIRTLNAPLNTMARIIKYSQRGFKIDRESFIKVMDAYANKTSNDRLDAKERLVMPYLNQIPEEVFADIQAAR